MSTLFARTPRNTAESRPLSETALLSRSCCCPSRPVVQVIMPPVPDRPHETDLLLCEHHFRFSRQALAAVGASVRRLRD
ncbi:MAG TPA: hypothetical protein VF060_29315 [Trebonia sp.]